jgi:hypothetical protein
MAARHVPRRCRASTSPGEIAKALAIAPSSVADHVKKVCGKLDVHATSELTGAPLALRAVPPRGSDSPLGRPGGLMHLLDSVGTGA